MKFTSTFLNLLSFAGVALSASQTVLVGVDANNQPGLFFTPNAITAAVGDTVNFAFLGGNHTLTQSPFAAPCTQLFNVETQRPGLDTGFVPTAAGSATPVVTISITDPRPMWFFCQQGNHCNRGMVMVINQPADGSKTIPQFTANAATAVKPGYGTFANFNATAAALVGTTNTRSGATKNSVGVAVGVLAAVGVGAFML